MTIRHTCGCKPKRGCHLGALLFRTGRYCALASHLEETIIVDRRPIAPKSTGRIGQALGAIRTANNARAREGTT